MTPLEQLLAIADAETLVLARKLIGREQLAILIAKAVLDGTTIKIMPTDVANILEMPTSTASAAIDRGRGSKSRQ
jgi:DNA-binding MarR family transcriptional regulator